MQCRYESWKKYWKKCRFLFRRDLFLSISNCRCKKFHDVSAAAPSHTWHTYNSHSPFFSRITEVVSKVVAQRPGVILVVPDWQTTEWFPWLGSIAVRLAYRACAVRVFELYGNALSPTHWGSCCFYIRALEVLCDLLGETNGIYKFQSDWWVNKGALSWFAFMDTGAVILYVVVWFHLISFLHFSPF